MSEFIFVLVDGQRQICHTSDPPAVLVQVSNISEWKHLQQNLLICSSKLAVAAIKIPPGLEGFWTLSIFRYSYKTQRFGNSICFRSQVKGETPTLLGT
jgi:hypothetical protein